jgi:trehalose 6-phosphate phosphatase
MEVASGLCDARVLGGKQVVNIVPSDAPHKGTALLRERERLYCDTALYVGDDETDEDVFRIAQPETLLTIRVGANPASAASYYLQNQEAIDALLLSLIELRVDSVIP